MSAEKPSNQPCEQCGDPLAKNSPGGLCPRCLMGSIFDDSAAADEDAEMDAELDQSGSPKTPSGPASLIGPPDPLEGSLIGNYKLLQRIGEGGFGVVYMAEQVEFVHRKVALKIIKAGMDTKQVIARFEAERQALAMMEHPNIARVLDVGETSEGRPYIVMELVKGMPITSYCHQHKLDIDQRIELFLQVCSAVQHAHVKGVIHRDLKPSNLLITLHDGRAVPKIIDFGIAKAMDQRLTDKTLFTRYEHMIGTPAYMSPEQAALSGLDVDTRSDVYSLGVLLYELLAGTAPFNPDTLRDAAFDEMRRIIREDEPPKPSVRLTTLQTGEQSDEHSPSLSHSTVSSDLDWIVMKALEKDRGRRYETAAGLAQDWRRISSAFATTNP
jgi:serine/threonine protein kinase